MSRLEAVHAPNAPQAVGPYSQAIRVDGWIFCSGQIPTDPQSGEMIRGSITEQTERVLANVRAVLEGAGASLDHVVKSTVFLVDMKDFQEMNAVYTRHFGDHKPARSTIQVAALPREAGVEIECIARVG